MTSKEQIEDAVVALDSYLFQREVWVSADDVEIVIS